MDPPRLTSVAVSDFEMDNGALVARVERNGTVAIADRRTGRAARGLGAIEDERDRGDSYTSSPRGIIARVPDAVAVRIVHAGPLRGELEIVRRYDAVPLALATRVRLDAGSGCVVFAFTGVNRTGDHRLRAVFPLGERAHRVVADGAFGPVEREAARPARRRRGEREASCPTAPMQRWVVVGGRRGALAVHNDGLPQYEARPNGEVLVTLLRAFGELSRDDLPERPGHAGWPTPTPAGQCLGPFAGLHAARDTGGAGSGEGTDARRRWAGVQRLQAGGGRRRDHPALRERPRLAGAGRVAHALAAVARRALPAG